MPGMAKRCTTSAHSVLRAVENRRPVMRAGNGGRVVDYSYGTVRDY